MGNRRHDISHHHRSYSPSDGGLSESRSTVNGHAICNAITCCRHGKPCAKTLRQLRTRSDLSASTKQSLINDEDETGYANLIADGEERKSDEQDLSGSYEIISDVNETDVKNQDTIYENTPSKPTSPISSGSLKSLRPQAKSPMQMERSLYEKSEPNWYLGEMTRVQAEASCRRPVSFRLYHRLPSRCIGHGGHLPPLLPLFIVYCTSRGAYCHYRVISRNEDNHEFRVDIPGEPFFKSLSALIAYYTKYAYVHRETGISDYFPWWQTKSDDSKHRDIYE